MYIFNKTKLVLLASCCLWLSHMPLHAQHVQPINTTINEHKAFNRASFMAALSAYKAGRIADGDAIASTQSDPAVKAALEWAAIRSARSTIGFTRLRAFLSAYPEFPMADWIRRRAESALFDEHRPHSDIRAFFTHYQPDTAAGKLSLARIKQADGDVQSAQALVKNAWRENTISSSMEQIIAKNYPTAINEIDIRYRAERLVYKNEITEALRLGGLIGPSYMAALNALNSALKERSNAEILLNAVPPVEQRNAPYILAKAQTLRRSGKLIEAAKLLNTAPREQAKLVNGHEWWVERRFLARKLMDAGFITQAYAVTSGYKATEDADRIDAEFMAGWIALRYLNDAEAAEPHFERASNFAKTPLSISRSNYWLGRARAAQNRDSTPAFTNASIFGTTYYGQLASNTLGQARLNIREHRANAEEKQAFEQRVDIRAFKLLMENNAQDIAQPLALDYATTLTNAVDIDAFNQILAHYRNAGLSLRTAKAAYYRGFATDKHAFPQFGIPEFNALPNSAEKAMVYAIARQESAFDANAVSHAGARGLMQMMPATAAATARQRAVPFALYQLTTEPQLNAQLGAAHLGELMQNYRGSMIMVFAAYNAGPGRVQEWVRAYGDPREGHVDAIDWIERIPITETRNYVQRVMENMQVYRALFSQNHALLIGADMVRGMKPSVVMTPDDGIVTGSLRR
jgi:soluble lytic murein transglycosylase